MRTMKLWRIAFAMFAAFSLASCSSDEPQWADPEAHEKTEQLNEQYGPLLIGTWHIERIGERQRFFERLTFEADGTLTGLRKWQKRRAVTVDDKETLTDWEDIPDENGTFVGTWKLYWERTKDSKGSENHLSLYAVWQDGDYVAFSEDTTFGSADAEILRIKGRSLIHFSSEEDGWISYQRGAAKPNF